MKKHVLISGVCLTLVLALISCGSANLKTGSSEYGEMVEKLRKLEFEIENKWAIPLKYNRVNLIGNPNHIIFERDSVDLFLPFIGERHSGGGYAAEGAIQYKGPLENLRIEEQEDRDRIYIYFKGKHQSENFDFQITVFPNGNTNTSVTSSQRDQINYTGKIKNMK